MLLSNNNGIEIIINKKLCFSYDCYKKEANSIQKAKKKLEFSIKFFPRKKGMLTVFVIIVILKLQIIQ